MKQSIIILFIFTAFSASTFAQNSEKDSIVVADTLPLNTFKPDPMRSVWLGAIIPGYGQIANRSFWKLPIVYAGFLGCTYAITLNSVRYNTYKTAFRDISDNNPNTNSFLNALPEGMTVEQYGGLSALQSNLERMYTSYRRYRDLSIIVTIGYYAVVLVEAYVEAQLFDFDISPDLSLHLRPAVMQNDFGKIDSAGVMFSLSLK
ncbi:MAG: DUF5683 domain-containing protein [Paludibacter sp.]|nr:DUF5683 domain-containing protein [Paludibacter sp.]